MKNIDASNSKPTLAAKFNSTLIAESEIRRNSAPTSEVRDGANLERVDPSDLDELQVQLVHSLVQVAPLEIVQVLRTVISSAQWHEEYVALLEKNNSNRLTALQKIADLILPELLVQFPIREIMPKNAFRAFEFQAVLILTTIRKLFELLPQNTLWRDVMLLAASGTLAREKFQTELLQSQSVAWMNLGEKWIVDRPKLSAECYCISGILDFLLHEPLSCRRKLHQVLHLNQGHRLGQLVAAAAHSGISQTEVASILLKSRHGIWQQLHM